MSPPLYQRLVDTLMNEYGYDYDATPDIIEKFDLMFDPGNIELVPNGPFNENQFATGGRAGFEDGGYAETVKDLVKAREDLPAESITVNQDNPYYEALVSSYAPDLAVAGNTPIPQDNLVPEVAKQNDAQKIAMEMQMRQSGALGPNESLTYNSTTGTFDMPTGGSDGSGIAGYQQYLDNATTASGAAQNLLLNPDGTAAASPSAGAIASAANYGDLAGQAAIDGQGASDQYTTAAEGYTGANAYSQFMSPYQQEIIDATQADMANQLAQQQAQLGASAGNAFGGGRFGVAEGQLASSGALGSALAGAQLRTAGYTNAQQQAAQAYQQQMGMGSQAMQQAQQNQGLYSQAQQNQLQTGQAQAGQLQNQLQNLGAQSQMQQGLGTLQSSLAAQSIGGIGQMGAQQQAQAQTVLDTNRAARRQIAYEPYERLSFMGNQLTGLKGGYGQTQFTSNPGTGTSPTAGILGLLTGGVGLATGIAGMMNPAPNPFAAISGMGQ